MQVTLESLDIDRLTVDQQLSLVTDLWNHILKKKSSSLLTDAQREELDRRIAEDDANPDDAVPWEEARKFLRAAVGR
jgi:putative addiction module component (TIGR02574 family)